MNKLINEKIIIELCGPESEQIWFVWLFGWLAASVFIGTLIGPKICFQIS